MRAAAEVSDPGSVQVTVTLTLSLAEWEKLVKQFERGWEWPALAVTESINELSRKMRERVYAEPRTEYL